MLKTLWNILRAVVFFRGRHSAAIWPATMLWMALAGIGAISAYQSWAVGIVMPLRPAADESLGRRMVGLRLDEQPVELRFRYKPSELSRSVTLVFNRSDDGSSFEALRLSSLPEWPSAWLVAENREARVVDAFDDPARLTERNVLIRFEADAVIVTQNGRELVNRPFTLASLDLFALSEPGVRAPWVRSPWNAMLGLQAVYRDGRERNFLLKSWVRAFFLTTALLFGLAAAWVLDAALARLAGYRRDGSRPRHRWMRTYPWWPFALMLALALRQAVFPVSLARDLYAPFLAADRFDIASFHAQRTIDRAERRIALPIDLYADLALVFGGASAEGDLDVVGPGWPEILQDDLDRDALPGYHMAWINLSDTRASLADLYPLALEPLLASLRPAVVVLSGPVNDFQAAHPNLRLAHDLGLFRARGVEDTGAREAYIRLVGARIRAIRGIDALAVYVDEPVDERAFLGDPMAAWREGAITTARREGAVVVELERAMNDRPNTWYFHEPDRLGPIGLAEVARRVRAALEGARDRMPPAAASRLSVESP